MYLCRSVVYRKSSCVAKMTASVIILPNLETYADMRAPYWIWKNRDDLDIIGFHGYRKFLDFRNILRGAVSGAKLASAIFVCTRNGLRAYDGEYIQWLLSQYDIIVTSPFDCSYNGNIGEDFRSVAVSCGLEGF